MSAVVTAIADRVSKLPELTLHRSSHSEFEQGHCALEIVSWLAGERFSDEPACTCPAIAAFVRRWNDNLPDDATRTRVLGPLLLGMLNTRASATQDGDKLLVRRSYMAIDWEIRSRTPAFLRAIGLEEEAKALEALPEITNARELAAAKAVAEKANKAASAAWSAAWSAVESAARSAVESAAKEEVEKKLSPAVDACHASGVALVKRMCALTEEDVKDWSWE